MKYTVNYIITSHTGLSVKGLDAEGLDSFATADEADLGCC